MLMKYFSCMFRKMFESECLSKGNSIRLCIVTSCARTGAEIAKLMKIDEVTPKLFIEAYRLIVTSISGLCQIY
jgi:hypothetical protein